MSLRQQRQSHNTLQRTHTTHAGALELRTAKADIIISLDDPITTIPNVFKYLPTLSSGRLDGPAGRTVNKEPEHMMLLSPIILPQNSKIWHRLQPTQLLESWHQNHQQLWTLRRRKNQQAGLSRATLERPIQWLFRYSPFYILRLSSVDRLHFKDL